MEDKQLWKKIESFQIDDTDAILSFSKRLARENNWTREYTERVITEYKRFIYLVAISHKEITPSDEVDQAWHLHLAYTKSYWHGLCNGILGVELHHLPTKGGSREQQRFKDQYLFTLELYRENFKTSPPEDIWPPVDKRFDAVESFVRVNTARSWLIPRPSPLLANILLIVALPIFLISCSDDLSDTDIWFWLKLIFGFYILYRVMKWLSSGGGKNSGGGGGSCGGCTGCSGCGGG